MKKLLCLFITTFLLSACHDLPDAPFGFEWGQSVKDTVAQNIEGFKVEGDEKKVVFAASDSAPIPSTYAGRYNLMFIAGRGLTHITFSVNVDKDSTSFIEGAKVYKDISNILDRKYGAPVLVKESVSDEKHGFYNCLKNTTCGEWHRDYDFNGMKVTLSARPVPYNADAGDPNGIISVKYEYYTDAMKRADAKKFGADNYSNGF